jgi:pimeloyl-ACP methyl ester carboxylesterase
MRSQARNAAIHVLEAGHWPQTDEPAAVARIREWGTIPSTDRYAMLARIRQRTLIAHGSKDAVVMPINAFLLAQHLLDALLLMYPDASHGAQSQHAEIFLEHARLFLNR